MEFSDETLMAYADGELDDETRRAVEQAMAADPKIAQQIAHHRELQASLRNAFDDALTEEAPDRLLVTAGTAPAANESRPVSTDTLDPAPAADESPISSIDAAPAARADKPKRRWSWPEWGAVAASLLLGLLIARSPLLAGPGNSIVAQHGRIVAGGALAAALTGQPGGARIEGSPIRIGLSFHEKSGNYCRTFTVEDQAALAGLACREANAWRVKALAHNEPNGMKTEYRMAGTAVPPIILQAVQDTIEGDALDAAGEAAARKQGWKPG
ncbi:MAG TPA: hypothetical protein VNQ81_12375 [Povalibacter sp.]|nr:hypothetical protein [Povalibacter sp.]